MRFTFPLTGLLVLAGGSARADDVMFLPLPPIATVEDVHVAEMPEKTKHHPYAFGVKSTITRRVDNALAIRPATQALDINSLGDVPDSSFYENRVGTIPIAAEDVFWGPCAHDGSSAPAPGDTLLIGEKEGGMNPGFVATDSQDRKYVVKFDPIGRAEMQTGADLVGDRLFWALGYSVAEDSLFTFRRDQLRVDPKATVIEGKKERPMRESDVDAVLKLVEANPDGTYRCQLSRFIPGKVLGPLAQEGTRRGDPNDRIPHEDRRSLRAIKVFAAWINHYDLHQGNILDSYVTENDKSFVRHFMIDFGECFAGSAGESGNYRSGFEYRFDPSAFLRSFFSLGFYVHQWEHVHESGYRGIGPFNAEPFRFEDWKPGLPSRFMKRMTDLDAFWAVGKLMALSDEHIAAAVRAGGYTEPAASAYLIDVLERRRQQIAMEVLERVNPAYRFELLDGGRTLAFADMAVDHGLADRTGTTWLIQFAVRGPAGDRVDAPVRALEPRITLPTQRLGAPDQLVVRIQTLRSRRPLGAPVHVHLDSWDDTNRLHVVGIDRWRTGSMKPPEESAQAVAQDQSVNSRGATNALQTD